MRGCIAALGLCFLTGVLSVLLIFFLGFNTPACRICLQASSMVIPRYEGFGLTTGQFLGRAQGGNIKYTYVVDGRTFTAKEWIDDWDIEKISSGTPLPVLYDYRNPSIHILKFNANETVCNAFGENGLYALRYLLPAALIPHLLFAWRMQRTSLAGSVPRRLMLVIPVQNMAAVVVATCSLLVLEPILMVEPLVLLKMVSIVAVGWATLAAEGLWRRSRIGWLASILGDAGCFALLVWCGMRGPIGLAASGALLGVPIAMLLCTEMVAFYFRYGRTKLI